MVKCVFCSREIRNIFLFCPYCGKKQKISCPGCGEKIPVDSSVCEFCEIQVGGVESAKVIWDETEKLMERCDYDEARIRVEELITNKTYKDKARKMMDEIDRRIKTYKESIKMGDNYLKQGRLVRARDAFKNALKANPSDHRSYLKLTEIEKRLKGRRLKRVFLVITILLLSSIAYYHHYRNRLDIIAITQLESLLDSDYEDIREASALTLGWMGNRRSVPLLKEMLHTDNETKKIYALSALAMAGERRVIAPLLILIDEGEEASRIAALYCIYRAFGDMRTVSLKEGDSLVILGKALLTLSLGDTTQIDLIRRSLVSDDTQVFTTLYLLMLLGDRKMVYSLISDISSHLESDDKEIRTIAALILQEAGVPDVPETKRILWESLITERDESKYGCSVRRLALLRNIIYMRGDEEFLVMPDIASLRERLHHLLSIYELGTIDREDYIIPLLSSTDIYDNLIANLYLFITERERGPKEVLKTFLRHDNKRVRFATAKLILNFLL